MKLQVSAAAAAVGLVLAAPVAVADTETLAKVGIWEAFGGTTAPVGPTKETRGVCGISSEQDGRYFGLKLFAGDDGFTIQMGTKEWNLDDDQRIDVAMQFDGYPRWTGVGTGMHFLDGDPGLENTVNRNELDNFLMQFRNADTLRIQFGKRDMAGWSFNLSGTNAVSTAFQNCIRSLK